MKTTINRFQIKKGNAALVTIVMVFAAVYSCFAQGRLVAYQEMRHDKVGDYEIRLASEVKTNSESVALNGMINSGYEELKPTLTPNGKRLYFSRSQYPDNTNGVADMEDIWYVDYDQNSNSWSQPVRLADDLNNAGPNFVCNVSTTGDTVILGNQYGRKGKMWAGVSYAVKEENGQWSEPMPIKIKNDYNISDHANYYVSLKSGVIISAVQRDGSLGERDLYVSFWNGSEATEPVDMGGVINTEMDESSPFLADDGKTLYFASKGHKGFGGYDIWVSHRLDESWTNWSEPENLGPAVNGAMDDEFFSITHDGSYAVFSKQVSVNNHDLYRISTKDLFVKPATQLSNKEMNDATVAGL